jgi:transcriptional regulator
MYIPRLNRVDDISQAHDLMQAFNFALLITVQENIPVATPLPFMLERERGQQGVLWAHLARANPQWKQLNPQQEVLVVFQGHHGYISPNWYTEHPSVPTWNYMTVHAYGLPRIIDDQAQVLAMVSQLADYHESGFETPWRMESTPQDFQHREVQAIVAFEIEITRLEAKFKLSQNRTAQDQAGVIAGLGQSSRPDDKALAAEMQQQASLIERP